ncbi:hypothetical protein L596_028547 [Steinernema carpocapsae]|uniref:NTR domain-containing protein n=1 Tax=Steinernema carpocapsae TaxID=34508 RepID=A0A4U5LYR7_STECR|nr:hypothetical protein L596_028547 [Steinernema carpocapsae]
MFRTLVALSAFVAVAFACTCRPDRTPQSQFCYADVVGLFKITKNVTAPGDINFRFEAQPLQIFKKNANGQPSATKKLFITTNQHTAACGLLRASAAL